jgi:hypothetical protein
MAENLKRLVYRTFSDTATLPESTTVAKLIQFSSDKFALELFLDIEFNEGDGSEVSSFLLEIDDSGKLFVRNFNISSTDGLAAFDPNLSFSINSGSIYLKTADNTFYSITAKKLIKYGDVVDPSISASIITGLTYTDLNLINAVNGDLTFYSNYTNELKVDGRLLVSGTSATVRVEDFIVSDPESSFDGQVVQKIVTPFIEVTEGLTSVTLDSLDVDYTVNNEIPPLSITANDGAATFMLLSKEGNLSLPAGTLSVTGQTTLTGQLNINGGLNSDSGAFTVADTTGNIFTSGTLTVTGQTQLREDLSIGTFVSPTFTSKFSVDSDNGNVITSGNLTVSGGNILCLSSDRTFNIGSSVTDLGEGNTATLNLGSQAITSGNRIVNIGANGAPGTSTTVNIGSSEEDEDDSTINLFGTVNVIGGTGSSITTDTLQVVDNEIVLNSNATSPIGGTSGIVINRGGSNTDATLYWNETNSQWEVSTSLAIKSSSNSVVFSAPTANATLTLPATSGTLALTSEIPSSFNLTDGLLDGGANSYNPYSSKAAGRLYTTDTAAPSDTTNTLNYDGILRSSQLFEGSTRVVTAAADDILDATITNGSLTYAPYSSRSAGKLYSGTTNPTDTTRLNYDGIMHATKFIPSDSVKDLTTSGDYVLTEADASKLIYANTGSSDVTIKIPENVFSIGTEIAIFRTTSGSVAITRNTTNVTILADATKISSNTSFIKNRYTSAAIKLVATNTWVLVGNIATASS